MIQVNQFYPDVTDDLIMRLYGLDIQLNDGEYVSYHNEKNFGVERNSIHSNFVTTSIVFLYHFQRESWDNVTYDLEEFFKATRPSYKIVNCRIEV